MNGIFVRQLVSKEQLKAATSADDVVAIAKEAGISYQYLY